MAFLTKNNNSIEGNTFYTETKTISTTPIFRTTEGESSNIVVSGSDGFTLVDSVDLPVATLTTFYTFPVGYEAFYMVIKVTTNTVSAQNELRVGFASANSISPGSTLITKNLPTGSMTETNNISLCSLFSGGDIQTSYDCYGVYKLIVPSGDSLRRSIIPLVSMSFHSFQSQIISITSESESFTQLAFNTIGCGANIKFYGLG